MADAAKILLTEGDAPGTPASGQSAIYAKTDHKFYRKDSTGTELELGASGNVSGDAIWDAAGDLVVGTGANTAGVLTKGSEGKVLTAGASTLSWETPSDSPQLTKIGFNTNPTVGDFVEGKLYYDTLWKTLSLEAGRDSTLQVGQEEWRRVYNTGAMILNGQAVYTNGVYSGGLPHTVTVALANSSASASAFVLGVATQDIDTNNYGFVTVRGNINGIKTDYAGWSAGDSLYLGDTDGLLTNVKPEAPLLEVRVGRVIDVHATLGIINVRINQMYQLDNLSDVAVSGVVANQILKFDGVSWVPADSATTASAGGTNFFLTDSETAIEGLSRENPCVVTWTGHGLVDGGHQVKFEGITQAGWTALNSVSPAANLWHTVTVINENSFSIPVDTSGYAAAYVPASDPGIYCTGKLFQTPDGTISESIDAAQSTGNIEALLDVYASPTALGRTTIEGGEWTFDTWGYASSATDTNVIVVRVLKRSAAGTETELFNVSTADLGTVVTLSRISTIQPAFTILATDHLVVRYFAKSDRGAGAYRQIYLVHGGTTHYSLFKTPLAVAHNQLGGLNTSGYRHLPAAVADSDFAVGQASDGNWIKKTLAEAKTILGSTGTNTGDNAANSSSHYIGTTAVALNRASAALTLAGITLTTPDIGTPTAGVLTACTAATAADNTATTALASTAFAKSQDAVLARLPNQAVNMTVAASGSSGITVADNDNIDFGTGNFTLVWRGSLPDWTPTSIAALLYKHDSTTGYIGYSLNINTNGTIRFDCIGVTGGPTNSSTLSSGVLDGSIAEIVLSVTKESVTVDGSVYFYVNGVQLGTPAVITKNTVGNINNNVACWVLGTSAARTAGTCSFAATYNRALTAAEVLDLYRNGINYSDKWGSQTAKTSGTLVIGYKYRINTYVSDDDFTNIGAASNASGIEFIATGTTPTHWAHSSSLVLLGATLALEPEGIQNNCWYNSSSNSLNATYPAAGWSLTRKLNVPRVNTAQPAFLAKPASDQVNTAVGSSVTVVFGTELIDQSNNFASNTFTAPITGMYQLSTTIYAVSIDTASSYYRVSIVTSNRNYSELLSPNTLAVDADYYSFSLSILADMDANDTAYVTIYQGSGAAQTDISADSYFSGFLVC